MHLYLIEEGVPKRISIEVAVVWHNAWLHNAYFHICAFIMHCILTYLLTDVSKYTLRVLESQWKKTSTPGRLKSTVPELSAFEVMTGNDRTLDFCDLMFYHIM